MIKRRIAMSFLGVVICAVNVGLLKIAALGVDPFQTLISGINKLIPIGFGTLYMIVNAVMLIYTLVNDRHYIGIATFINLFLLGYITQFTYEFLLTVVISPSVTVRILCIIIGILFICLGASLYITANLGVSAYDAIALILTNKYKIGQFRYIRIATDIACVILGCVLFLIGGGTLREIPTIAGFGTIATAFFMGPLIDFFNKKIANPLLNISKK